MPLKPCSTLQGGKYHIIRFISSGGFGCTYEAWHSMFGIRIAIKEFFVSKYCIRDEATGYVSIASTEGAAEIEVFRKRFIKEAASVFSMKHPGIVQIYDIFEENGTAYYVMEYLEGGSLADYLLRNGNLDEKKALGFIRQTADALAYIHSLNFLHLDLKPSNLMLDNEGKVKIIDFGASKYYDSETGENTSTLLGIHTPGFAPIEQSSRNFNKFSASTDIYSLGATLYNLLTGTPPTDAISRFDGDELPPLPPYISTSTRKAVEAAMRLQRDNRPQSIVEFMEILDAGERATYSSSSATLKQDSPTFFESHSKNSAVNSEARKSNSENATKFIGGQSLFAEDSSRNLNDEMRELMSAKPTGSSSDYHRKSFDYSAAKTKSKKNRIVSPQSSKNSVVFSLSNKIWIGTLFIILIMGATLFIIGLNHKSSENNNASSITNDTVFDIGTGTALEENQSIEGENPSIEFYTSNMSEINQNTAASAVEGSHSTNSVNNNGNLIMANDNEENCYIEIITPDHPIVGEKFKIYYNLYVDFDPNSANYLNIWTDALETSDVCKFIYGPTISTSMSSLNGKKTGSITYSYYYIIDSSGDYFARGAKSILPDGRTIQADGKSFHVYEN